VTRGRGAQAHPSPASTAPPPHRCAEYERQLTAASAAQRELKQSMQALREQNETLRVQVQRSESRVMDHEITMQQMANKVWKECYEYS
jgi:hypothetical protein